MSLHTCTVSGNSVAGSGGAVLNASFAGISTLEIASSTIANNTSAPGGAGVQVDTVGGGSVAFATLRNSLVAGNGAANFGATAFSGGGTPNIDSAGFNLSDRADATQLRLSSDQNSATAALGALAANGGPTPTHALGLTSEARDGRSNDGSALLFDQRGATFYRLVDLTLPNAIGGDGTDVGAIEAGAERLFGNGFEA